MREDIAPLLLDLLEATSAQPTSCSRPAAIVEMHRMLSMIAEVASAADDVEYAAQSL